MKKTKIIIGVLAVVCGILAVIYEMKSESTLVFHPKGIIAQAELNHMVLNILIMLHELPHDIMQELTQTASCIDVAMPSANGRLELIHFVREEDRVRQSSCDDCLL